MNGSFQSGSLRRMGFVAVLMLSIVSLRANPVSEGEGPLALIVFIPITLAILLEAICVWLILRRGRTPRFFILWLLAMHLVTYPLFLGFLWLLYGTRPAFAMTLGEAAIVLVEGSLIYLMCRFISSRQSSLPVPSVSKSLFASLIGNICSAAAFPLLLRLFGLVLSAVMPSGLD
jgi:hypothetical protein